MARRKEVRKMASKHHGLHRKAMPLELVDALNAYQATGRVAVVYPFVGKIALNGYPSIPYADALATMQFCLQKGGKNGK